jgi:hypothetical protein
MTRTPLTAAALMATLALAACGSSNNNDNSSAQSRGDKAFDGAVKFSRCMREHGINIPDPQRAGSGGIKIVGPGKGASPAIRPDQPKFQAAQKACEKYLEAGGGPPQDPQTQAKIRDALVQYAGCMRAHGVDMPDPKSGPGGGILIQSRSSRGGSGNASSGPRPDSPAFKAADKACHSKLAGLPGGGPMTSKAGG